MLLNGKHVAVLGGSSGIGFAVAKAALAQGAVVRIGSSNTGKVAAAVDRLGAGASGLRIDLTDDASVAAFFAAGEEVDHLIYTAGDWTRRNTAIGATFDLPDARAGFETRFWGVLLAVKHALPHMPSDGSITLTSGLFAHRPAKGSTLSTALTGAVEHLAKGLAIDLAPVRVNVVTPGFIATEAWAKLPTAAIDAMTATQPLPRAGLPAEAAEAYLYFMRASYTTGQVAVVDGGRMFA
jgi:NAD(P)-dependent dehydrogenase (short-subunit alcohol dehydrogenase family)